VEILNGEHLRAPPPKFWLAYARALRNVHPEFRYCCGLCANSRTNINVSRLSDRAANNSLFHYPAPGTGMALVLRVGFFVIRFSFVDRSPR